MSIGSGADWGINHLRQAHRKVFANSTQNPEITAENRTVKIMTRADDRAVRTFSFRNA